MLFARLPFLFVVNGVFVAVKVCTPPRCSLAIILVRNNFVLRFFLQRSFCLEMDFPKQLFCRCAFVAIVAICFANSGNVYCLFCRCLQAENCLANACCCALSSTFCHHVVGNLLLGFRANAVHNLESFAPRCKFVGKWCCRCQQNLQVAVEVEQSFLPVQVQFRKHVVQK